jgi:hypothetical protein
MIILCLDEFKNEFEKLIRNNSYSSIEIDIIEYFFNKNIQELSSGIRLNNSDTIPFIKKRIKGRGGYRFYFLLIIKDEKLYLLFVHPKSGSLGFENIADELKTLLYKKVLECIKSDNLFSVTVNKEKLIFTKL